MGDHYEFHRAQGGGLAEPAYALSWICGLTRQRPVSVVARAAHLSDLPSGFNDLLDMIIDLDGGSILNVHYTLHEKHDGTIGRFERFACEYGTLASNATESRFYDAASKKWIEFRVPPGWNYESVYLSEMKHFLAALEGKEIYQGSLQLERCVLATLLAAEESSTKGQKIGLARK